MDTLYLLTMRADPRMNSNGKKSQALVSLSGPARPHSRPQPSSQGPSSGEHDPWAEDPDETPALGPRAQARLSPGVVMPTPAPAQALLKP